MGDGFHCGDHCRRRRRRRGLCQMHGNVGGHAERAVCVGDRSIRMSMRYLHRAGNDHQQHTEKPKEQPPRMRGTIFSATKTHTSPLYRRSAVSATGLPLGGTGLRVGPDPRSDEADVVHLGLMAHIDHLRDLAEV